MIVAASAQGGNYECSLTNGVKCCSAIMDKRLKNCIIALKSAQIHFHDSSSTIDNASVSADSCDAKDASPSGDKIHCKYVSKGSSATACYYAG